MYYLLRKEDTVRIPPDRLGEDLDVLVEELTHTSFEGMVENGNFIVLTTGVDKQGEGRIIHGDGGVYQKVRFEALVFRPELQEVVQGTVCEVLKFGAFVRFGPLDGLLHISQIMDDRIDIDEQGNRLVGKGTRREIRIGDDVRARIVAVSINERSPRESKIGLTMRQPGLGKSDWLEEERGKGVEGEKPAKKTKKKAAGGAGGAT